MDLESAEFKKYERERLSVYDAQYILKDVSVVQYGKQSRSIVG